MEGLTDGCSQNTIKKHKNIIFYWDLFGNYLYFIIIFSYFMIKYIKINHIKYYKIYYYYQRILRNDHSKYENICNNKYKNQ